MNINGIRVGRSPIMVWLKDEPGGSLWDCNTPNESHRNDRDPQTVWAWDYTVKDDLKELIGIIYTNKMHLLFGNLSLKNSMVKHA